MTVEVRCHKPGRGLGSFLHVSRDIYAGCSAYVQSLDLEQGLRLSPITPFARHQKLALLTAFRDGKCVGRCTVQADTDLSSVHPTTRPGYFSYLDTIDDPEVVRALLAEAKSWLRAEGKDRIIGPTWLGVTEPSGVLVSGFSHSPAVKTSYHHEYQGHLLEQAGFTKAQDLLAWRFEVGKLPRRARATFETMRDRPEITCRTVSFRHRAADLEAALRFFDGVSSERVGQRSYTALELRRSARELAPLVIREMSFLAYVNGELAGVAITVPNTNESIKDLNGSFSPGAAAKLLYRLRVKHPDSARVLLFGLSKKHWQSVVYRQLGVFLHYQVNEAAQRLGYRWAELSMTGEGERELNCALRRLGAKAYRRFRVYQDVV